MTHAPPKPAILKLAVLIDGDNIAPQMASVLWRKITRYGLACVRYVYCGELKANGWKEAQSRYALSLKQQAACASGKNATDIAMVIDALDIAQMGLLDGFCLVSSDSDFTPLALRLKEAGYKVFGFGKSSTPDSLRKACHEFELLDIENESSKPEIKAQALAHKPKTA